MGFTKKQISYSEQLKLRREMSRLQSERRKFAVALKYESNNDAMDSFCLRGLKAIDEKISRLSEQI